MLVAAFTLSYTILLAQNDWNQIEIGSRLQLTSVHLDEERAVQVYLPPTYYFSDKTDYPVIYLLDGDYNFHYVTGVVELMSNVSGEMPECIVVGISDKGTSKYRRNCTPNQITSRKGNAQNMMRFISDELKPLINTNYRTADYDIIIGHSIGGLFVTNYSLEKPNAFDAFIAIDPALWLGEYEIINRADSMYNSQSSPSSSYYISSSDTPYMGIDEYVAILERHFPKGEKWKFFRMSRESHNSVGLPTIKRSFEDIFSQWSISREQFMSYESAHDLVNHYQSMSNKYSLRVAIPSSFLGNVIYYYVSQDKKEDLAILEKGIQEHFPGSMEEYYNQLALTHFENNEYKKAIEYYSKSIQQNPSSFYALDGLAKVFAAQEQYDKARAHSKKSIEMAKKCQARQWILNQLMATLDDIREQSETKK